MINRSNQFVYTIGNVLYRLTEPALRPIRRFMPNLGGIDLSPIVLLLLIFFLRNLIYRYGLVYLTAGHRAPGDRPWPPARWSAPRTGYGCRSA